MASSGVANVPGAVARAGESRAERGCETEAAGAIPRSLIFSMLSALSSLR